MVTGTDVPEFNYYSGVQTGVLATLTYQLMLTY